MAGAGYKLFNTGDVLTAAQVNTYLQEQVVMVFANAAARTTALSGVVAEGMVTYLKDTDALEIYSGTAWVGYGSGDITGVTAGTGISGGGTSGTVTITNSMATEITAAGDIIVGTGSGTFDNLPIGTTGQILTADTTVSPYKVKWAAAAASGAYTSLATGTLSGGQVDLTSISGSYQDLVLIIRKYKPTTDNSSIYFALNADRNNRYSWAYTSNSDTNISFANNYFVGDRGNDNSVATGLHILTIRDYANTSTWKMGTIQCITVNATTTTNFNYMQSQFFYNQTAAITQINILDSNGAFTSGDYVLYGVK